MSDEKRYVVLGMFLGLVAVWWGWGETRVIEWVYAEENVHIFAGGNE